MNRPEKLSHRDTVVYEIDMLEYCYEKLVWEKEPLANRGDYALLECFLLHYRNLIDFFGKAPQSGDLSISRPEDWAMNTAVAPSQIQALEAQGKDLCQEYDDRKKRLDTIFRYLHHCTTQRTEFKDWPVKEMFEKIKPLTERFWDLLENRYHIALDDRKFVVGEVAESTMTSQTFRVTD